ncbi:unnamed protein product, partial [Meganyctiphanes norvegica]
MSHPGSLKVTGGRGGLYGPKKKVSSCCRPKLDLLPPTSTSIVYAFRNKRGRMVLFKSIEKFESNSQRQIVFKNVCGRERRYFGLQEKREVVHHVINHRIGHFAFPEILLQKKNGTRYRNSFYLFILLDYRPQSVQKAAVQVNLTELWSDDTNNYSYSLDDEDARYDLFSPYSYNATYNRTIWVNAWNGAMYPSGYTTWEIILITIVVTAAMIVVVVGNMLVIIAIATEKTLKNLTNWFIASLAVSDFLLGLIIMPFSLANLLMGYWMFGELWCEFHAAIDVLLCTASINNICLISLDRYWSITHAVAYLKKRTPERAAVMIVSVWVFSGLVSIPPLLGWKKQREPEDFPRCEVSHYTTLLGWNHKHT